MTLRQNKVAIRLGNFVFRGDDFGIVIKRDETIVGGRVDVPQSIEWRHRDAPRTSIDALHAP